MAVPARENHVSPPDRPVIQPLEPAEFLDLARAIERQVGEVIVGQAKAVRGTLICLTAAGHALLEGVPGLGKTTLARAFAATLGLSHTRIQFTPDLMPADITGTMVLTHDETGHLRVEFQPGPVFAGLVLADEINRASPRTQSALLEAMQEGTVTIAGETRPLPHPFCVLATQNPVELHGTYPLPEAQLDRFLVKLRFEYPTEAELQAIIARSTGQEIEGKLERIGDAQLLLRMIALVRSAPASSRTYTRSARQLCRRLTNSNSRPAHGWNGCVTRTLGKTLRSEESGAFDESIQRQARGPELQGPTHQPPQLRLPRTRAAHQPHLPLRRRSHHQPTVHPQTVRRTDFCAPLKRPAWPLKDMAEPPRCPPGSGR